MATSDLTKEPVLSSTGASTGHPSLHHRGGRLKEFFRPNGRKVCIAHTPEEEQHLKGKISQGEADHGFDVVIHGSDEHLDAVKELHAHHEARRNSLREKHSHVYDQFENVKADLDALATELQSITDHGIALDANFSKYGYSAHLRTRDEEGHHYSTPGSGQASRRASTQENDRSIRPLIFWKRPVVRQYLHKGLLWRSPESGEVMSFELFADLLYVGILEIIGDAASENPTGIGLVQFGITFVIAWKIWTDLSLVVNMFELEDIFSRFCVFVYLICLLGFTTNIVYAFETTYTAMIAFYVAERIFQGLYFLWVAYLVPMVRGSVLAQAFTALAVTGLWIGSIHVEWPNQLALIFIAIFLDLFGYFIIVTIFRWSQRSPNSSIPSTIRAKIAAAFDFFPAINIEHRIERTNAFVSLVFGASVLAILYQNHIASAALSAFFGKACLALLQAAAFNWIYFDIDAARCHVHAIRRHSFSAILWSSAHIPFIMAYVLAATAMSKLVLAHDSSNTDPHTLGEEDEHASEEEINMALRWFYCAGLAIALVSMAVISMTHIHKTVSGSRIKKEHRLAFRCIVALAICLLPLAKSLSSLSLMAITCCLVSLVLFVDIFGLSCSGDHFWRGGFCDEARRQCQYQADCPLTKRQRKRLNRKLRRGEKVDIEDILAHTGKGNSELSLGTTDDERDSEKTTANNSQEDLSQEGNPRAVNNLTSLV